MTYTASLCKNCQTEARNVDVTRLSDEIKKLTEEMFPTFDENLVEMKEAGGVKRMNDDGF